MIYEEDVRFHCTSSLLRRINGQLVALKVIRMKTEEGIPFTAIREGDQSHSPIILT